ncbi:hypothetical protein [Capsulimonas corticalis]|uniref:hypothetical protein n=1 Tax=Capsulimonas corticalis TaxID=2219043 RepID=UPI001FE84C7A|nr:hypothetical protein [Capsulimonas corticalis]
MAQAAPLQPGRGQATILRFLGDLHRLRAPGAPKRSARVAALGQAGGAAVRLARRIQFGSAQAAVRTGPSPASERAAPALPLSHAPVPTPVEAAPAPAAPFSETAVRDERRPNAAFAAPDREPPRSSPAPAIAEAAAPRPPAPALPTARIAPRESLADQISTRRQTSLVTPKPSLTAPSAETPLPAIAEAYRADLDLPLSRAAIPAVSWLGVSAPEPATPEPESFSPRIRMPETSSPAMPPLAPRFSSVPADTMARTHAPAPLPTSDVMRREFASHPPTFSNLPEPSSSTAPAQPEDRDFYAPASMASAQAVDEKRDGPFLSPSMEPAPAPLAERETPQQMPSEYRSPDTAPAMVLPRTPAPSDETTRRAPDVAAISENKAPFASETILREVLVIDPVMRALPRLPHSVLPGVLARSPFVPSSLASLGDARLNPSMSGVALPLSLFPASSGPGEPSGIELAPPHLPVRAVSSASGGAAVVAPMRTALATERMPLPARAVAIERDAMDHRVPEMPLPPRDRTAVMAASHTLMQRSEIGSAPSGAIMASANPAEPPAQSPEAGHTPEPESGGANDVNLLASEVWSLLRRRLAYEAERMGR